MQIIKNFSKSIRFTLHITSITLAIIAIVFLFTKQLFIGDDSMINHYEIYTKQPVDFTILGTVDFSKIFIEFSEKHTQVNQIINFTDNNIAGANNLKLVANLIMAASIFILASQLFNFRDYAIFASSLITIILLVVLESIAIRNFADVGLITAHSKQFVTIIILLAISAFVILLEIVVKYLTLSKSNNEN